MNRNETTIPIGSTRECPVCHRTPVWLDDTFARILLRCEERHIWVSDRHPVDPVRQAEKHQHYRDGAKRGWEKRRKKQGKSTETTR